MRKIFKILLLFIICAVFIMSAACDDVEGRADSLSIKDYSGERFELPINVTKHTIYSEDYILFDTDMSFDEMAEKAESISGFSAEEKNGCLLLKKSNLPIFVIARTEGARFAYRLSNMTVYMEENGECNYTGRLAFPEYLLTAESYSRLFGSNSTGHIEEGEFYQAQAQKEEITEFYRNMGYEVETLNNSFIVDDKNAVDGALAKFELICQDGAFCIKRT